MVCSTEALLEKELKYLKYNFHKINGYPGQVIDQFSRSIKKKLNKDKKSASYPDTSEQPVEKLHFWIVPHAGPKNITLLLKQ